MQDPYKTANPDNRLIQPEEVEVSIIRLFDSLIDPIAGRRYVGRHRALTTGNSFLAVPRLA